jgi:hypothetical protein
MSQPPSHVPSHWKASLVGIMQQFSAKNKLKSAHMTWELLTVDCRIKVHMDLQADKFPVVVKGPFFP